MVKNKKLNRKVKILLGLLLFGALLTVFYFGVTQSVLLGAAEIGCAKFGNSELSCSPLTRGDASSIDNKFHFITTKPSASGEIISLALSFINGIGYGNTQDNGYIFCDSTRNGYAGCIRDELFFQQFGLQLITIEGTYDFNGLKYFKAYGLCREMGYAWCWADVPKNIPDDARLNINSIKISIKRGGYTETDVPVYNKYYNLENNACVEKYKLSSEKTDGDYFSLDECNYFITKESSTNEILSQIISIEEDTEPDSIIIDKELAVEEKSSFSKFISFIINWFKGLFNIK